MRVSPYSLLPEEKVDEVTKWGVTLREAGKAGCLHGGSLHQGG